MTKFNIILTKGPSTHKILMPISWLRLPFAEKRMTNISKAMWGIIDD